MSGSFSASPAMEPGDALIRVAGRADLARRSGLVLRFPDLGDRSFRPIAAIAQGADLVIRVGPEVTERLDAGTHYDVVLPNAGIEPLQGNVRWPAIKARSAGSRSIFNQPGAKAAGSSPPVEPVSPSPPVQPLPVQPPLPIFRRRWRWLLPAIGLSVIGLGLTAGAWWEWRPALPGLPTSIASSGRPVEVGAGLAAGGGPAGASQAAAPVVAPAIGPADPSDPLASLDVSDVIARAGSAEAIGREGETRLDGGRPDDGILLLEAAAERGDATAMAKLAHLYDPNGFNLKGPIPSPDIRESARYYRDASRAGGTSVNEARGRLRDALDGQARAGDQSAALALRDFWP